MSTFHGIAPTHRMECTHCDGTGSHHPGRKCYHCHGECYMDVDLTTEERLERIEEHLGIGWSTS